MVQGPLQGPEAVRSAPFVACRGPWATHSSGVKSYWSPSRTSRDGDFFFFFLLKSQIAFAWHVRTDRPGSVSYDASNALKMKTLVRNICGLCETAQNQGSRALSFLDKLIFFGKKKKETCSVISSKKKCISKNILGLFRKARCNIFGCPILGIVLVLLPILFASRKSRKSPSKKKITTLTSFAWATTMFDTHSWKIIHLWGHWGHRYHSQVSDRITGLKKQKAVESKTLKSSRTSAVQSLITFIKGKIAAPGQNTFVMSNIGPGKITFLCRNVIIPASLLLLREIWKKKWWV